MRNILILIFFVLFITGCSSISTTKNIISQEEKLSFVTFIEKVKTELKEGKTELVEESLVGNLKNYFLKSEIKNLDFSKVNIISSKPVFTKNKAKNVVGFIVGQTTLYFDVDYLLKNGKWKILNIKERRG